MPTSVSGPSRPQSGSTPATQNGSSSLGPSLLRPPAPRARVLTPVSCRIGLASYIYSLDGQTTYNYLPFAASAYDKHSLISTIQVAQSIISTSRACT